MIGNALIHIYNEKVRAWAVEERDMLFQAFSLLLASVNRLDDIVKANLDRHSPEQMLWYQTRRTATMKEMLTLQERLNELDAWLWGEGEGAQESTGD